MGVQREGTEGAERQGSNELWLLLPEPTKLRILTMGEETSIIVMRTSTVNNFAVYNYASRPDL
jgi:hypothetical protein